MSLNLTTNSYEKMTDTNKLLYLILGELREIKQALNCPQTSDKKQVKANTQPKPKKSTTGQIEGNQAKAGGFTCKFCGEVVEGNRGNLLAHIRQCPERKKGSG
jgi:hypothetical protein